MTSPNDFRKAMEEQPDDVTGMQAQADLLQEQGDPRGLILAAACERDRKIEHGALSQNQSDLRVQYRRIMRGDVPLDPEHLEATLRFQYAKQVELLTSLKLLKGTEGKYFIIAVDGERYPLPAFDEILAKLQTPELLTKLTQGFDTLLLVPFGLELEQFFEAWCEGLRRNASTLHTLGAFREPYPLTVWNRDHVEPLVYDHRSFTDDHGGRTQEEILAQDKRGWDVLLVEGALQNLPRAGQVRKIGGRKQIGCNRTPNEYLAELLIRCGGLSRAAPTPWLREAKGRRRERSLAHWYIMCNNINTSSAVPVNSPPLAVPSHHRTRSSPGRVLAPRLGPGEGDNVLLPS